jgi:LacI family transcriptional regulator
MERSKSDVEMVDTAETREAEGRDGRVTIVDVARHAGVSKSTVSLVLSGSSLVAEPTRERVNESMAALGYIYHRGAATLRGARSGVLGMVINDLSNPFFVEMAIGAEDACQGGAFIPFLAHTVENPGRQLQVIRSMREHGAAGLLLSPAIGTLAGELRPLIGDMPVVQVMRRVPGFKASFVAPENKEGARHATEHLAEHGHKRIAFVGGFSSMSVRDERLAGYRAALEQAGLAADPALVIETMPSYAGGGGAVAHLFALREPATSALCFNDAVAIGLMRSLAAARVEVGKAFSLIGFDDIDEAKHTYPALTSVAVNARSLGARAAQMLMRQLASGHAEPETVLTPTTLMVRASCGGAGFHYQGAES